MTEWKTVQLGEVCTLQRGMDLPKRLRHDGEFPLVTSSGIDGTHSVGPVKGPGVITGRYGTIGKVFFVEPDFWPLNTTLYVRDFHGNDVRFVHHLLQTVDFQSHSGKSGVPGVNRNDVHQEFVHIPARRSEQEAIAKALLDADALIDSLEQLLTKKRQIKQGAMQELLTGKRRLPGFHEAWAPRSMANLFEFSGGLSASRDQLGDVGTCYLHYGDIHLSNKTYIDLDLEHHQMPRLEVDVRKVSHTALLQNGDVVFVDASEDDLGVSKHVVIQGQDARPLISGLHTIVAKPRTDELVDLYKRYCFQAPAVHEQFRFYAVGTKVSGVSKGNIGKIVLRVPSPAEQAEIAGCLSEIDSEICALEARLAKARDLKRGMAQALLTGRIRLVEARAA